ncbi:hypothetical protein TanjilG_13269 [Lupinus angustifolius]|uniref:X8 domain-containing protein n=1 Tax=Lupinus angustifolius TaxID=3871 RepID=A0A4P1RV41_LUPAN|nr:PREDICTED: PLASMODESMATA CALLOSE-BINDING PROTEIN 3-like isoform X2 [Lupinus angustifolius]OIW18517.1 hypothetical protein TanjilG_13269 [Lupinus angustifolius]
MAAFALSLLLLAFFTPSSSGSWCVCKDGSDTTLQKTLDYACGAGADCNPLHQNGPCFQPNTVRAHCNYAVNSYYQKKGQAPMSCDFAGSATVTASDPSSSGCSYPSSASAGTSTTPVSTTPTIGTNPTTGTPSTTTGSTSSTGTTTPYGTTPGVLGGIGTGMGPSGSGMNTDESHGGHKLVQTSLFSPFSLALFFGLIMLWWG